MTKPESIRRFDLFYLGSLLLSLVTYLLDRDALIAGVEAQASGSGVVPGATLVDSVFVIWIALLLLLWFLVSARRVGFAKWLVVLLVAINLVSVPGLVRGPIDTLRIVSLLSVLLTIAAAYYLFRPDAKEWFAGAAAVDTAGSAADD